MKELYYKGILIERNIHGMYVYFSSYRGMYIHCELLEDCKRRIREEKEIEKTLSCHYR